MTREGGVIRVRETLGLAIPTLGRGRLMDRLRRIVPRGQGYAPVMQPALR